MLGSLYLLSVYFITIGVFVLGRICSKRAIIFLEPGGCIAWLIGNPMDGSMGESSGFDSRRVRRVCLVCTLLEMKRGSKVSQGWVIEDEGVGKMVVDVVSMDG